jgi:hypothetical protein
VGEEAEPLQFEGEITLDVEVSTTGERETHAGPREVGEWLAAFVRDALRRASDDGMISLDFEFGEVIYAGHKRGRWRDAQEI